MDSGTPSSSSSVNRPSPLTEEISGDGGSESISSLFHFLQLGDNPANPFLMREAIDKKIYQLIRSTQRDIDIRAATERIYGEKSDDMQFMKFLYEDLVENGAESKAFKYGVGDPANFAAESQSPLDPFCIHPLALALGLGLVILISFFFLRKVWKNR